VVSLLLFGAVRGRSASPDNPYNNLGVYSEVLAKIKLEYVEEPDMKAVTLGAINGMLESIDPFASYLNADQYKQYQESKRSPKADVGLYLSRRFGYMTIVDAAPGSPAAKSGLTTGDVIETINNVSTRDMPLAFAGLLLEGQAGTQVELSVLRTRQTDPQKFSLVRAQLTDQPVTGQLNTAGQEAVGVITVPALLDGRSKDIAARIADLEKQGAKRLILDLRHCYTGSGEEGVAVANLFMDKGLIAYLQGQRTSRQDFQASASKAVTKLPLEVLVDRGTAGAAEVAAAALLDSKRAGVIGERTYGDAALRKAVTLDDGSAVILSVAKYYSPSGKAIQDTGVTPTVLQAEVEAADADDDVPPDAAVPAPGTKPGDDNILKRALQSPTAQPVK
jgi:carboxyl-terminal processing protease